MARKRKRLDLEDGRRLLAERLGSLLDRTARPPNPALDLLTGAASPAPALVTSELEDEPDSAPAIRASPTLLPGQGEPDRQSAGRPGPQTQPLLAPVAQAEAPRPGGRQRYIAATVYLNEADLLDVHALAEEWSERTQHRVSRSAVLRVAVRWLKERTGRAPIDVGELNDILS